VAQAPSTPAEYLARIDLDGDGRISLTEFRDYMSRGFRDRDRDDNAVLEGDELPVPGARPVHLADHLEALARSFARQDRNGDGFLDADELAAPPR
jgi:Ca2+-binding EF-hand superfamily protein